MFCVHCAAPTTNDSSLCDIHDASDVPLAINYCSDCGNEIGGYKSPWNTPTCNACDDRYVYESDTDERPRPDCACGQYKDGEKADHTATRCGWQR